MRTKAPPSCVSYFTAVFDDLFKINREAAHFRVFLGFFGRAIALGQNVTGASSLRPVAVVGGSFAGEDATVHSLGGPDRRRARPLLQLACSVVECGGIAASEPSPVPPDYLPSMPIYRKVAIVGVGLIGGSIGLALKQRGLAEKVVGIGRRQSSLDRALSVKALDDGGTDLETGVDGAELVVVATPVAEIADLVCRAAAAAGNSALVTDAGSTKATICADVESRLASAAGQFVGSHPLAGDHRTGPENARGDLLADRTVVVTPTASTPAETVAKVEAFWQSLGAEVTRLSPAEHDEAVAATSHLPHLVASALAAATPAQWLHLASTGWADTTRIAAGDSQLWAQIFAQNRPALLEALHCFEEKLQLLHTGLTEENWLELQQLLLQAKRTRDALGD